MKLFTRNIIGACLLLSSTFAIADSGVNLYLSNGQIVNLTSDEIDRIEFVNDINQSPTDPIQLTSTIRYSKPGGILMATAVVSAQSSRGLILTDNSGSILYYDATIDLSKFPVGTVVNVLGGVTNYDNCIQLSKGATIINAGELDVEYPTPFPFNSEDLPAYSQLDTPQTAFFSSVSGVLAQQLSYPDNKVSYLFYTDAPYVAGMVYFPTQEILSQLIENHQYNFIGYFLNFSDMTRNGVPYRILNMVVTELEDLGEYQGPPLPVEPGQTEDSFSQYLNPSLELNNGYIIGHIEGNNVEIANPIPLNSAYGYLLTSSAEITADGTFSSTNDEVFFFTNTLPSGLTVPQGYFLIRDSNNRYLYLQDPYKSFNCSASVEADEDNVVSDSFLFSASINDNGNWTIKNRLTGKNIYYSSKFSNFAAYDIESEGDYLPQLFHITTK
ncbi:MAG: hypothetical protein J1F38_05545 [Muribaculaceae bacterium]|nr:hypothetical protein [Muribaculaceae bacterium]